MKRIVFLVSGGGSNLKFIHFALKALNINASIVGVIADREILFEDFLKMEEITFKKVKYSRNNNQEMLFELKKLEPDVIVTNIHKILDINLLTEFKDKFINLHYSILPAFSGLIGMKTIEESRRQNVRFVGGTCHEVNENVDAGEILFQSCFSIDVWNNNNYEKIIDTVFKSSCLLLLSGVLIKLDNKLGEFSNGNINGYDVKYSPALYLNSQEFATNIYKKLL